MFFFRLQFFIVVCWSFVFAFFALQFWPAHVRLSHFLEQCLGPTKHFYFLCGFFSLGPPPGGGRWIQLPGTLRADWPISFGADVQVLFENNAKAFLRSTGVEYIQQRWDSSLIVGVPQKSENGSNIFLLFYIVLYYCSLYILFYIFSYIISYVAEIILYICMHFLYKRWYIMLFLCIIFFWLYTIFWWAISYSIRFLFIIEYYIVLFFSHCIFSCIILWQGLNNVLFVYMIDSVLCFHILWYIQPVLFITARTKITGGKNHAKLPQIFPQFFSCHFCLVHLLYALWGTQSQG